MYWKNDCACATQKISIVYILVKSDKDWRKGSVRELEREAMESEDSIWRKATLQPGAAQTEWTRGRVRQLALGYK